jgi:hypothetical protein
MPIPNSDRHGLWINDGSATPKLAHAAWTNNGGMTAAKEIWINNAGTHTRVWPPRAYVVELVPIGTRNGSGKFTAVDTATLNVNQGSSDPNWNNGNWNAIWGGMYNPAGESSTTYAFRRWDKYDSVGHYNFSTPNNVRRTTATGTAVGQGHGGLWKTLLQTSPYNLNDKTTHSPFVVIEPGSKILCIRACFTKTYSQNEDEAGSTPVSSICLYSGNASYFGNSVATSSYNWVQTVSNDIPVSGGEDGGGNAGRISVNSTANNTLFTGLGMAYGKGLGCRFGLATDLFGTTSLNTGTWMSAKNYGSSPTSTFYGYGDNDTKFNGLPTSPSATTNAVPFTLPVPTGVGHVGWKYIQFDADDSTITRGSVWQNYNINTKTYDTTAWAACNTSLGSTLFLVIPP